MRYKQGKSNHREVAKRGPYKKKKQLNLSEELPISSNA